MRLQQIVPPATPIITLADAYDHLRVTGEDEGARIAGYVEAANAYLEARDGVLGEALVTQTWRLYMDAPAEVLLPIGPVQSVAVIKYIDGSGAEQTFNSANYRLSGARVELVDGASWPVVASRSEAFWIDFVAGYGTAADVPATARQTALLIVGELYQGREMGSEQPTSDAFKMLFAASRSARGLF
jgi:uncharacterized phiE125 gp8 family phage protein